MWPNNKHLIEVRHDDVLQLLVIFSAPSWGAGELHLRIQLDNHVHHNLPEWDNCLEPEPCHIHVPPAS